MEQRNVKGLAIVLLAFGALAVGLYIANAGIQKYEKVECKRWALQATTFESYYITQWQADQCARYGIEIEAPIQ